MASGTLPSIKSPRSPSVSSLNPDGLLQRKVITNPKRRTKSLIRRRPSYQIPNPDNAKINFSFATSKKPKV